jgi:hypothetical protein
MRTIERLTKETSSEEQRRSPPAKPLLTPTANANWRQQQVSALSSEDPVIKNEIVEKYLESQNELRAKMERQYLDAVARNEIKLEDYEDESAEFKKPVVEEDSKRKKKKDKRKNKEGSSEKSGLGFASASEILSRLPPIDPSILEELKDFTFYVDPQDELDKESHSEDTKETDNLQNKSTSLSSSNQQESVSGAGTTATSITAMAAAVSTFEPAKKLLATKIDWGDSDDEEDFEEVKIPEASIKRDEISDEVDHLVVKSLSIEVLSKSIPDSMDCTEIVEEELVTIASEKLASDVLEVTETQEEAVTLREVDESEVERLHSEKISNLNGNTDKDGQFREWQETLTMESFNGDLLHILPYTIIDF